MHTYYITIPYSCHMFRRASHHLQGELNVFLIENHLLLHSYYLSEIQWFSLKMV